MLLLNLITDAPPQPTLPYTSYWHYTAWVVIVPGQKRINKCAPATCVASYNVVGRGYKLISFRDHFPFHLSSTTTENGNTLTFHPSMTETCTEPNAGTGARCNITARSRNYIDNHTHDEPHICNSRTTPLELIRN